MLAIELAINGVPAGTAGIEGEGSVNALLSLVLRRNAIGESESESISIQLSAYEAGSNGAPGAHLRWVDRPLTEGDVLTLRVVSVSTATEPQSVSAEDPASVERAERRYYERLKSRFETTP